MICGYYFCNFLISQFHLAKVDFELSLAMHVDVARLIVQPALLIDKNEVFLVNLQELQYW